jgi:hypothetical protein
MTCKLRIKSFHPLVLFLMVIEQKMSGCADPSAERPLTGMPSAATNYKRTAFCALVRKKKKRFSTLN